MGAEGVEPLLAHDLDVMINNRDMLPLEVALAEARAGRSAAFLRTPWGGATIHR